jgi:hypothetical protein
MGIDVSTYKVEPTSNMGSEIKTSDNQGITGALVDRSIQSQFHSEPIYEVNSTEIKGWLNYKEYDIYSGHAVETDDKTGADNSNTTYTLKESGKKYQSGKTYYLGFKEEAVPAR